MGIYCLELYDSLHRYIRTCSFETKEECEVFAVNWRRQTGGSTAAFKCK